MRPRLKPVGPGTVGCLVREFEASPRFARYAPRTRQDYTFIYRDVETHLVHNLRMFGELNYSEVTKQLVYTLYEQYVVKHGNGSANRAMSAWQAVFKYGRLKIAEITFNPFLQLDKQGSPPRRQRWTDQQLNAFIKKADKMGYSSVGRCALICMELVQRPGDVLSMRWGSYEECDGTWSIRQSKRGTEVRIPSTERLRSALVAARRKAKASAGSDFSSRLVCATVTGKRWHRRNFTKTVRRIARAAGLPDDLQIRDLRRTGATEGASAGATPAELMAVGGWVNQASIRPYLVQTLEQATNFQAKRDDYCRRKSPAK